MMEYRWINPEKTMIAQTHDDGHVVVIEPGHDDWPGASTRKGVGRAARRVEPNAIRMDAAGWSLK